MLKELRKLCLKMNLNNASGKIFRWPKKQEGRAGYFLPFSNENDQTIRNPSGILPKTASPSRYKLFLCCFVFSLFTWGIPRISPVFLVISTTSYMGNTPCLKRK